MINFIKINVGSVVIVSRINNIKQLQKAYISTRFLLYLLVVTG